MTKSSFSDLLVAVKRHWTSRDGLVVLLDKANPAKPGCRLCVPGLQPSTMVPELCILWKDDEAIYKGRLDSHELRCKLTDEGVCRALFTSTRLMQSVKSMVADVACYGNCKTCKGTKCKLKSHAEPVSVQGP